MGSTSDASGSSRTTLTFNAGTNIDVAQVQVQNKLQQAMSRLPPAVQSRGVTVTKGGNDYLMIITFTSPDPSVSQVDIGDYISSNLVDVISRIDGVGDVLTLGTGYAMRVWLDPGKLEKYALMPSDIGSAINAQNAQVSAGQLGALPAVGAIRLVNMRTVVVLPAPFGPKKPNTSPSPMSNVRRSTAKLSLNFFVRFSVEIIVHPTPKTRS